MSVYIVKARGEPRVKIGFSEDVYRRMAELQTGCPYPLELLAVIDGGTRGTEQSLHAALSDERLTGEWFSYTGKCYAVVQAIVAGARPTNAWEVSDLVEFATSPKHLAWADGVIRNPESTPDELRQAHILRRQLTRAKSRE